MSAESTVPFRYQSAHCSLLDTQVWAIVTRQPDGTWKIVNCLDKDASCLGRDCAFTTEHGRWPFNNSKAERATVKTS